MSELVRALEGDEEAAYAGQQTPETESIAADERMHAAYWFLDEITVTASWPITTASARLRP